MMGNELAISPSKLATLPNGHPHLTKDFSHVNGRTLGSRMGRAANPRGNQENSGSRRLRFRACSDGLNYRLKWPRHTVVETSETTNSETSSIASSGGGSGPKRRGRKRIRSLERALSPGVQEDGLSNSINGSLAGRGKGTKRRRKSLFAALPSPSEEEPDPLFALPSYPLPNLHDVISDLLGDACPFAYTWDKERAMEDQKMHENRELYRRRREEIKEEEIVTGFGRVVKRPSVIESDFPTPVVLARKVADKGILISWNKK